MPRRYEVTGEQVAVTAASDLVQISGASNKIVKIIRWWWRPTDNTLATAQVLATRCRRLPTTVTNGNGSAATPRPLDPGDTAAVATALTNSTSKATTNGTAVTFDEGGAHIWNGYEEQPELAVIIGPTDAFVFELLSSAIQGTVHLNFGVEFEEIG